MGSEPQFPLYKKFKIVLESWLMAHFVGIFILNNFKKNTYILLWHFMHLIFSWTLRKCAFSKKFQNFQFFAALFRDHHLSYLSYFHSIYAINTCSLSWLEADINILISPLITSVEWWLHLVKSVLLLLVRKHYAGICSFGEITDETLPFSSNIWW